jgi:hypothetical protein
MTEHRKLCKDCLHYKKSWLGHLFGDNSFDKCFNPILTDEIIPDDLVTGDKTGRSCKSARNYYMYCGADGRYFEQLWGDRK